MKKAVVLFVSLFVSCTLSSHVFGEEVVRVVGSGGPQLLLRDAAAEFMKNHRGVKIEVPDSSGTGGGLKSAGEGTAELGRVSRKLNENERQYGLKYLPFAKSPVVLAAHSSVGIKGITRAESRDLFSGKITNWKGVGGPDMPVRVVARQEGEANLAMLKASIKEWRNMTFAPKVKYGGTDQESVALVANNKGAIGFCPLGEAIANKLIPLALDGARPGTDGYPIYAEYAFVYKPDRLTGATKDFVDFIFSPAGEKIIRANNALPLKR